MADQPEALRLADRLDLWGDQGDLLEAAAELRRLHAENERIGPLAERVLELKAQRDALLEALKEIDSWLVCSCIATAEDMAQSFPHMQQVASAAIKAAEGENHAKNL